MGDAVAAIYLSVESSAFVCAKIRAKTGKYQSFPYEFVCLMNSSIFHGKNTTVNEQLLPYLQVSRRPKTCRLTETCRMSNFSYIDS